MSTCCNVNSPGSSVWSRFNKLIICILLLSSGLVSYAQVPDANGIVYIKPNGAGDGSSWANASSDLHNAIHASGVLKVFVAIGTYNVGSNSFVMKNGVKIYGGFDPANGIVDLDDNRILPNHFPTIGGAEGSILNGQNTRAVIWNEFTSGTELDSTAVLDGFTIKNGYNGSNGYGGGLYNKYASPTLRNLVIRQNNATFGGAMFNSTSSPLLTDVKMINNSSLSAAAIWSSNNSSLVLTNVEISRNWTTGGSDGEVFYSSSNSTATLKSVTIVDNNTNNAILSGGATTIDNSIIYGGLTGIGNITKKYSLIEGNTDFSNGNINAGGITLYDIFTDPYNFVYTLNSTSPALNKGSNALFPGLNGSTKDLAGNPRVHNFAYSGIIDMGAYESAYNSPLTHTNGIIYVTPNGAGDASGKDWNNATADLHNAIHLSGVEKVFVAIGNYNVGDNSFVMKNNVAVYGGFDPANGIDSLDDNRILPNLGMGDGSVLNGQNTRPLIWNVNNGLTNTALLDGFTLTNGHGNCGAMYNQQVAPKFNNLVIKNNEGTISGGGIYNVASPIVLSNSIITNNTAPYGGGIRNNNSNSIFTNVSIKNNTATMATTGAGGGGIFNELSNLLLTNVLIADNSTNFQGGGFRNISGNPVFTNVTLVNNSAVGNYSAMDISTGIPGINNSIIYGTSSGTYTPQYSSIEGNTNLNNGNIAPAVLTDVFTNPSSGNYTLKLNSPAVNAGNNALYPGLAADTKDLAGNPRVYNFGTGIIDMGAYESTFTPIFPTNGIVYVKQNGTGDGSSWLNATYDLHNAIHSAGVQKVFVAIGNYDVGQTSFIMKNGVEIYGGFDPDNGVEDLDDSRIMPDAGNTQGSVLNGQGSRPVFWNVFTDASPLDNTAVLNGFTVMNGNYANGGGGIRNVYASPSLQNLVIRDNNTAGSGAGIYNNNNSGPNLINSIVCNNTATNSINNISGAGIYNNNNSNPTIVNTTIANNKLVITSTGSMNGAGIFNGGGSATTIYNSIIWDNKKNGNSTVSGADMENIGGTITLKSSITQSFTTGVPTDNNQVGVNPLFSGTNFMLQPSSPAINSGDNSLFSGLDENTNDLGGNARLSYQTIDIGAYEFFITIVPDVDGIVYVRPVSFGLGDGSDWDNATHILQDAIDATGTQKVFVAIGNYNVGDNSFVMKNNVEIYGGFDPANGIVDLDDDRILPNKGMGDGSVLNGLNTRPLIWNDNNGLDNTALLDGFTLMNGKGVYTGAIFNSNVSPSFNNLVIRNNEGTISGGAMYNSNAPIKLSNSVLKDNTAGYGGAIRNNNSDVELTNVILKNNTATLNDSGAGGGAIFNQNSNLVLTNVAITDNNAYVKGGGIRNLSGNPTLINVSLINNTTVNDNSTTAMEITAGDLTINNSIVFGTIAGSYNPQFSLIEGNTDTSNGNIDAAGLTTTDVFTGPATGDYTLKSGSVAVNAGSNALFPGLDANTLDLAGNPRVYHFETGGIIDMGAYESEYNSPLAPDANGIIYVKPNAQGSGNGNSWDNATSDLHNAIHIDNVQKVFVAIGNYDVGDNSFVMKNNVEIYGGFDPENGIEDLDDERILPNRGTAEGAVLNGQNVRTVVWNVFTSGTALNTSAVLDGFTVMNGLDNAKGGGIRNIYASPTLRNLVVKNNTLSSTGSTTGGGIFNQDLSSPVITNTIIKGNTATIGSAMANVNNSNPVLTNVLITGNTATHSSDYFKETVHTNNSGIYTNVTIAGNNGKPLQGGGGNAQYSNVIALGNSGSFYNNNVKNSIISGNTDMTNGNIDASNLTDTDIFTDPVNGDYTLKSGSVAVNAGSNALFPGLDANTLDLAGNPRVYDYAGEGIIDIGAYEYQGTPLPIQLLSFTVQKQGENAVLTWRTANEQNNHGFEIQRSTDGKHWTPLTFIPSQADGGNSLTALQYGYTDDSPAKAVNYYRLKQIDRNGSYEYSIIRSVSFDGGRAINVYPNPAIVQVTVTGLQKDDHINLVDGLGNIVRQYESSNEKITVPMDQLQRGFYYIIVSNGDSPVATFKVVKGE